MQLTPEIKAQLEAQKASCIFCKIINKEIDSQIVFEDDVVMAALDINPAVKGHAVYFLKEHYPIMPYIPAHEFKHYFGLVPQLVEALQKAMAGTGTTIFIANGGAAGQQSPHFLFHFFPRDSSDGNFAYLFDKRPVPSNPEHVKTLSHNLPIMMRNHFSRNPASWHTGVGARPAHLEHVAGDLIYEDEQVLVMMPNEMASTGHFEIYSKLEESDISKLSIAQASHFFYVGSFAATALFEGLGAHATNIIVKSGVSADNPSGKLVMHVIIRMSGDDLGYLHWAPQAGGDLSDVGKRIRDATWKVNYEEEKIVIDESSLDPEIREAIKRLH